MSVNAIIQARCGSTRFPNKVFALIDGKPLLWHVVNRLKYATKIDDIIVATTVSEKDDKIEEWCKENNVHCFPVLLRLSLPTMWYASRLTTPSRSLG